MFFPLFKYTFLHEFSVFMVESPGSFGQTLFIISNSFYITIFKVKVPGALIQTISKYPGLFQLSVAVKIL